jgi:hypothetical protein
MCKLIKSQSICTCWEYLKRERNPVPTYITQTGDCYCQKEDFNISSGVYSFCWRDFRQSIFSQLVSSSLLLTLLRQSCIIQFFYLFWFYLMQSQKR